jgi:hypothetical protein
MFLSYFHIWKCRLYFSICFFHISGTYEKNKRRQEHMKKL